MASPIFGYPDFTILFVLYTDASDTVIGAALSKFQNGQETVISYWSRQLTKSERNYSTIEHEALTVVGAVKEFYPYLYGLQFKLVTNHNPLTFLKDLKDVGGRLARWMLYLQQFNFSFEDRAGKDHGNADAMSRLPVSSPVFAISQQFANDLMLHSLLAPLVSTLSQGHPLPSTIAPGLRKTFLQEGVPL